MRRSIPATERRSRDYLRRLWNERDYRAIPETVSPDFVMVDPVAIDDAIPGPRGEVHGPVGLETFVRGVEAGFPDFRVTVHEMLTDDDCAMYTGVLTMTHLGDFCWFPPTGRRIEVQYMGLIRVADGKVVEHRVYPPMLDIFGQLGFTSPAVLRYLPKLAWGLLKHRTRSLR